MNPIVQLVHCPLPKSHSQFGATQSIHSADDLAKGLLIGHLVVLYLEAKANFCRLYCCSDMLPYIQLGARVLVTKRLWLRSTVPLAVSLMMGYPLINLQQSVSTAFLIDSMYCS
jgi:hypothetical protein